MTAVFSHGRLRLYLLKLLAEAPRHGYELIRLLENRFLGLYAPSAGTIYPRLQRMEADGLVRHTASGGRKVYEITEAGRAELAARADELAALDRDIRASVADLSTVANEVERGVHGSVRDMKRELRQASRDARTGRPGPAPPRWSAAPSGDAEPARDAEPSRSGPGAESRTATELEWHTAQLLAEVRRLARAGRASPEALRTALIVVNTALDQVRRLLR
jgi:DNA-binding PadR family transcriptional regulator